MLPFLSVSGILLSAILIYFNFRKNRSTLYLGFFFFLISLYAFNQYVMLYSKSVLLVSIFFLNTGFLTYLIGPMLYWYVRSVLTDDSRLKKQDLLHLLPMLIFLVAALPYMFSPWTHKVEIATKIVEDSNYIWIYKPTFLARQFLSYSIFLSRPLIVLGYTFGSIIFLIRYRRINGESKVLSHQHFMSKWLIVLFAFLTIWFVSHALQVAMTKSNKNLDVFYTLNALQLFSGAGLIGLLISPFFFPGILYGLPRFPERPLPSDNQILKPDQPLSGRIRESPDFEAEYITLMQQKTDWCMNELQPYLLPDCNLAYVSKLLNIPAHHLAYYFRDVKKQSFNDYRNTWRVNHAKSLIIEGKLLGNTIEAIGHLSGFSSANTFHSAFKKVEGISPGSFAAQAKP